MARCEHSLVEITTIASVAPLEVQRLNAWDSRIRNAELAKLGAGGPSLMAASFTAGINHVTNTLQDTNREQLRAQRDRDSKSFTQKHGAVLAERMHRWCDVHDDAHLPGVHILLAKSTKSRDYAIINSLIQARVMASPVPLTLSNCPLPTTKLIDDVFRSLNPASPGLVFAYGLSPFTVVCDGHAEMDAVRKLI